MESETIDNFIDRSQPSVQEKEEADSGAKEDEWNQLAPGVDSDAYIPKAAPAIPLAPPADDTHDTGRIPDAPTERKDIEDLYAQPGVCGLLNMGNTCYMNAGLQCIHSIPQLAQYYLSDGVPAPDIKSPEEEVEENSNRILEEGEEPSKIKGQDKVEKEGEQSKMEKDGEGKKDRSALARGHVSARFSALVRKLWSGQFSALLPKNFKTTLGLLYPQFSGFRQQDSHEFLAILLDRLHEDIVQSNPIEEQEEADEAPSSDHSIITDSFQGQLTNEVTCCTCGHSSTKTDPFMYLSLPLPHSHETQLEIYWVPLCTVSEDRKIIKHLVTVSQLATLSDVKEALCSVVGGGVLPESVVMAYVKGSTVDSVLMDSLDINRLKSPKECSLYAYQTGTGGVVKEATRDSESVRTSPSIEEEGLPAKILRCDPATPEPMDTSDTAVEKVVVMEWHSCAICLEEMVDEELVTHAVCGAILCSECLQSAQRHAEGASDGNLSCPVCRRTVDTDAFKPLATPDKSDSVVRLLQVTIIFRYKDDPDANWKLAGHPAIVNLPCSATGEHYHTLLSLFIPSITSSYTLSLTDQKGNYCSRCEFTARCNGCLIPPVTTEKFSLKPGDHIAVSLSLAEIETSVCNHSSLDQRWSSEASLKDCIELFSQRELLSSDNPWHCPTCQQDRPAHRQLRVSSLPPTLIIHLKRFLFHGRTASKVNMFVDFPQSFPSSVFPNLSSSPSNLLLTACVCHFGSADCGHYTAYSRHPLNHKWYYYNDETATEEKGLLHKHKECAYILFYQQQQVEDKATATSSLSNSVKSIMIPKEQEELLQMTQLMRVFKPKLPPPSSHLPSLPPLLPIRRSSSLGNIADVSGDSDSQLQLALAASLGLDHPTPSPARIRSSSSSSNLPEAVTFTDLTDPAAISLKSVKMKLFDA